MLVNDVCTSNEDIYTKETFSTLWKKNEAIRLYIRLCSFSRIIVEYNRFHLKRVNLFAMRGCCSRSPKNNLFSTKVFSLNLTSPRKRWPIYPRWLGLWMQPTQDDLIHDSKITYRPPSQFSHRRRYGRPLGSLFSLPKKKFIDPRKERIF